MGNIEHVEHGIEGGNLIEKLGNVRRTLLRELQEFKVGDNQDEAALRILAAEKLKVVIDGSRASAFLGTPDKELESKGDLPSERALKKAMIIWSKGGKEADFTGLDMMVDVARLIDKYIKALEWCSGSSDFGHDGQARVGWLKLESELLK